MPSQTLLATLRWTWLGVVAVLVAGTMVMAALSTSGSGALLNGLTASAGLSSRIIASAVDRQFLPYCGTLKFAGGGGTATTPTRCPNEFRLEISF